VKPDNIMIERDTGRAVVMDFGIALVTRGDDGPADPGIMGTARYMSPEQACGEPVDSRSDLYSLGATAFYALAGRAPFEAATTRALLARHVGEPAPPLLSAQPELPAKLAEVVDRCLAKEPSQRVQTGEEFAAALDAIRGKDLRAPPLVRSFVRNAQVTTMVLLTIAVVGGGVGTIGPQGVSISLGPIVLGGGFFVQLVAVARRLLREGYAFEDIRQALLAEAQAQSEEADLVEQGKWMRRVDSLWSRLWAGKVGRWFFRIAGWGVEPGVRRVLPSADATELVLGRAATEVYDSLPPQERLQLGDVRGVIQGLEQRAERLRERGEAGPELTNTVAALENIRIELLRLRAGIATVDDLTKQLQRAAAIGEAVDHELEGRREVERLLGGDAP
jgi:serine/threonine-protein kinase